MNITMATTLYANSANSFESKQLLGCLWCPWTYVITFIPLALIFKRFQMKYIYHIREQWLYKFIHAVGNAKWVKIDVASHVKCSMTLHRQLRSKRALLLIFWSYFAPQNTVSSARKGKEPSQRFWKFRIFEMVLTMLARRWNSAMKGRFDF